MDNYHKASSTGVVSIPLMKKTGLPGYFAAAVEAIASNGGQLAPPVMGATIIPRLNKTSIGRLIITKYKVHPVRARYINGVNG